MPENQPPTISFAMLQPAEVQCLYGLLSRGIMHGQVVLAKEPEAAVGVHVTTVAHLTGPRAKDHRVVLGAMPEDLRRLMPVFVASAS